MSTLTPIAQAIEKEHALLAPSAAYTWIECPASTAAQIGQPDESSEYADDGTASHELMKWCLENGTDCSDYMGRIIKVGEREFEVDDERAEYVQIFVDRVRDRKQALELAGAQVTLRIEQALSIEHITGEKGAKGTSDVIIIAEFNDGRVELEVWDLKYGRGVEVSAERNYQAMIYAAAADAEYAVIAEFDSIRVVIHQPRVNPEPSEWALTPQELYEWVDTVAKPAAARAMHLAGGVLATVEGKPFNGPWEFNLADFNPGEKQCRWCKAKAVCPALSKYVETTIGSEFQYLENDPPSAVLLSNEDLGLIYPSLPLIEAWGKAVLARIEHELLNGQPVPGTKLVQGRRGHRKWVDEAETEALLKSMRLKSDEMYNRKVISPTQAEKLLAKDAPRRWKKVESLITQKEGAPHVAPESDKRPALVIAPPEDDFAVVNDGDDLT